MGRRTALPEIAREVCDRAGVQPEDLTAVVLHQANLRIITPLAAQIGATEAVVATDVVTSGNTSAASIPIALSKLSAATRAVSRPVSRSCCSDSVAVSPTRGRSSPVRDRRRPGPSPDHHRGRTVATVVATAKWS